MFDQDMINFKQQMQLHEDTSKPRFKIFLKLRGRKISTNLLRSLKFGCLTVTITLITIVNLSIVNFSLPSKHGYKTQYYGCNWADASQVQVSTQKQSRHAFNDSQLS